MKLAKSAKITNEEYFEIGGENIIARAFKTRNSRGHIVLREKTNEYISKIYYHNRTWENYTFQSVLKEACENIGYTKEFKEYDDKRCHREHEETKAFLKSFEEMYNKTSDTFKEKVKDITLNRMEDAKVVKTLMAFDILLNK